MPRKRGRKKKSKKIIEPRINTDPNDNIRIEDKPAYPPDFADYGLNVLHDFTRAREEIFIICFRVPMTHISKEDIVDKYKSQMVTALQALGKKRGMIISTQHIHFDALPQGHETIIKAWADIKNISGRGVKRREESKDPLDWGIKAEVKQ